MSTFSLPCPPSPVMLYIGAGYDLSPLLSFAPGGPPYPIVPLSEQDDPHSDALFTSPDEYSSFLFVDAKPRFTSAYMVSDFHEWTSIEARVRNVLHYAQGSLSRWRVVPGAPDLIWFEGGGDAALVDARSREPAWVFPDTDPSVTSPPVPSHSTDSTSPKPLITLLYLFNTLDIELVQSPLLDHVWPRVEALYVHGLRLHQHTGAGMSLDRRSLTMKSGADCRDSSANMHRRTLTDFQGASLQTQLGTGLKRCYVIVGSWGTPLRPPRSTRNKRSRIQGEEDDQSAAASIGVRHVDFVAEAWRRWKLEARMCDGGGQRSKGAGSCPSLSILPSSISSSPPLPSTPSSISPIPSSVAISTSLRSQTHVSPRRRVRHPEDGCDSDYDGDSEDAYMVRDETEYMHSHELGGGGGMAESTSQCIPGPFHIRIPQLAWSSSLRGGRGGYFIEKTVEESLAVWRSRKAGRAGGSEEDESANEAEVSLEEDRKNLTMQKKNAHYLYGLRSFFNLRAVTPSTSLALAQPISRTSNIARSRSRKPLPPTRPKLRPRPPTPAPRSGETESENSSSETVFGMGQYEGDRVCEYQSGKSGVRTQIRMGNEKENVAFGFLGRGLRARGVENRIGVGETRGMTRGSVVDKTTSGYWNHSSKSLDAVSHTSKPRSPSSPRVKSRERRIDIADFLSTTWDPKGSDTISGLSSTDAFIPDSTFGSEPVIVSSDLTCDTFALDSAPTISNLYPTSVTRAFSPFSSPSFSPVSSSTTFPRSPYCPSDLFNNGPEQNPRVHSRKKWRPVSLPLWAKTKEQREESSANTYIPRAGSISWLFGFKMPGARDRDGKPPSGLPVSSTGAPRIPPHKTASIRTHSHTHTRAHNTQCFQCDPDAPPVPRLPSHFRHAHTQSLCDPITNSSNSRTPTHLLISSNAPSISRPTVMVVGDTLDGPASTPPRQSNESDKTCIGDQAHVNTLNGHDNTLAGNGVRV